MGQATSISLCGRGPNMGVNRSAEQRRCSLPAALRAPAPGYPQVRPIMTLHRFASVPLVLVVLTLAACASGSAIVTGKTRAPIPPEQVRLYLEPPSDFEVIAVVSA
jgi:hypothetical protein